LGGAEHVTVEEHMQKLGRRTTTEEIDRGK
jgi:hypothetical protein